MCPFHFINNAVEILRTLELERLDLFVEWSCRRQLTSLPCSVVESINFFIIVCMESLQTDLSLLYY